MNIQKARDWLDKYPFLKTRSKTGKFLLEALDELEYGRELSYLEFEHELTCDLLNQWYVNPTEDLRIQILQLRKDCYRLWCRADKPLPDRPIRFSEV